MLLSLEHIVGVAGYFIDNVTHEIWSFKRYKDGRKIKLFPDGRGYLMFDVCKEGKRRKIMYHQLIVRLFVDPDYDSKTQEVDHLDHNKLNNSIDNLRVVSKSENLMNRSYYRCVQAIYLDDIRDSIAVNAEHGVYYSKTNDKFYRFVDHIGKYRQLTESKHGICMQITYAYNKKNYNVNTTKFRQSMSK